MAILIAIFNNMSGIGIVSIYAISIFDNIAKQGGASHFSALQDSYFVSLSGVIGAMLSYYTVALFSRRAIFIGGHFLMAVCLFAAAFFIQKKQADLVLLFTCSFIIIFQATQGTVIFIYIAEIVASEVAMGLALFTLMICLTL